MAVEYLLKEDGDRILQEDNDQILLESSTGAYSQDLTETASLSHSALKLVGIILFEGMTLVDPTVVTEKTSPGNNYTVTPDPTETATLSDTLRVVKGSQQLTETLVLGDTVRAVPTSKQLTESAVLLDTGRAVKSSQQATESAVLTSTPQKGVGRQVSEAATLADALTKGAGKALSELATLVDSAQKDVGRVLTEGVGLTDTLTKAESKALTETVGLTDVRQLWKSWHYPTESISTVGTPTSGSVIKTWLYDGVEFVLSEVTGTPGFDHAIRWGTVYNPTPSVPTFKLQLTLKGYYDGNAGHVVRVDQWDFVGAGWVDTGARLTDSVGATTYTLPLLHESRFLSAGAVFVRFYHSSPGNPVHLLHIDELFLSPEERPVETATLTDTLRVVAGTKQLTETVGLTDPIVTTEKTSGGTAHTLTPPPTETAVLADTVRAVLQTKQLMESAALVDTLTKGTGKVRTETATLADVVTKGEGRALVEVATLTATPTKAVGRAIAEVATLVDVLRAPKGTQQLSELVSLTDLAVETQKTSGGGTAYTKNLTETATLADTLRATAGTKQLTEGVTLADTVRPRAGTKQASELVTLTATLSKDVGKTRTETATLTDIPTKGTGKQVTTQVATLSDTLRTQAGTKQATETVVLDASPTKATARTLTESLTLTDLTVATQKNVASSYSVTLTEDAVLSDGLTANKVTFLITVTKSLRLTDVVTTRVVRGLSKSQTIQLRDTVSIVYTTLLTPRTEVVGLTDVLDITNVGKILTEQLYLGDAILAPDTYSTESSLVFAG